MRIAAFSDVANFLEKKCCGIFRHVENIFGPGRAAPSSISTQVTGSSGYNGSSSTDISQDFEAKNLYFYYELYDMIDHGEHWAMVKAIDRGDSVEAPQKTYAIKKCWRWGIGREHREAFLQEAKILKQLDHQNVVKIYRLFRQEFMYYYAVLEHLEGGELLYHVGHKGPNEPYNEETARALCRTIIRAIRYVHEQHIVHRDINPGSFALATPGNERSIKLTGFGAACSFREGLVTTRVYADTFVAPEILAGKPHGSSVDMWNIGRVVYILISGYDLIVEDERIMAVKDGRIKIVTDQDEGIKVVKDGGEENLMEKNWGNISEEAKDFVRRLLEKEHTKRMTAEDATKHPWLDNGLEGLASNDLSDNIRKIKLCNLKRRFKDAIRLYLVAGRFCGALLSTDPRDSEFRRTYELVHELGRGSYACVHKIVLKDGGAKLIAARAKRPTFSVGGEEFQAKEYAAKQISRKKLSERCKRRVFDEVCILGKLDHENVIKMYDFYHDDPMHYYIVLELMRGGELFRQIEKKQKTSEKTKYNEQEVRDICCVLFEAVKYIHSKGIVHRDLKPENILLASEHDIKSIRLADFGFACDVKEHLADDCCGTPWYMAPEIINHERHGKPVDMWSVGVIIYNMLAGGQYPFGTRRRQNRNACSPLEPCGMPQYFMFEIMKDIMDDINTDRFKFELHCWSRVSEDAKDLIDKLLTVDPSKRLTASEAIEHPWLKRQGETLASNNLACSLKQLQVFNARRKFRGIINTQGNGKANKKTSEEISQAINQRISEN